MTFAYLWVAAPHPPPAPLTGPAKEEERTQSVSHGTRLAQRRRKRDVLPASHPGAALRAAPPRRPRAHSSRPAVPQDAHTGVPSGRGAPAQRLCRSAEEPRGASRRRVGAGTPPVRRPQRCTAAGSVPPLGSSPALGSRFRVTAGRQEARVPDTRTQKRRFANDRLTSQPAATSPQRGAALLPLPPFFLLCPSPHLPVPE